MTAPLAWMDVISTDFPRSVAFYGQVFGWVLRPVVEDDHPYNALAAGDELVAGAEAIPESKGPPRWTVFVTTDDMSALLKSVLAAGGAVTFDPMQLGDYGIVAMITDPFDATIGVWQPLEFDPHSVGAVEGRFAGAELVTADVAGTVRFLTEVLGWTVADDDSSGLVTLDAGGYPARLTAGDQSQWRPILRVVSQDSTVEAIARAGGSADAPRLDGVVVAADPMGAQFLLAP
ncbi:VOC family protein [Amnibacterium flavum]|uniref:VOC domain-containing protein n=1 Tax=Amnibacterium flavum TaxID=2173173 RepID=A0A2V1HRW6_9MICO|nr:VOC family protein [Amnibacterium flavum]PVZ95366.1 hypothetical protein DDQ50_02275 [Amnibacterium flavum]